MNHPAMTAAQLCAYHNLCTGVECKENSFISESPEVRYHMARGMFLVTTLNVPHQVDFLEEDPA